MIRIGIFQLLAASSAIAANPHLDYALGVLAESRDRRPEAEKWFESARLADPLALPLVQRSVRQRLGAGDRSGAVKLYRDLAAARPDDLAVQLTYTDFLDQQSNGDSLARKLSIDALEAALAKFPGHPQIIRRLFEHALPAANKAR